MTNQDNIEAIKSRCYSLADISEALGITRRTLCDYIKAGKLKGVKLGGKWIITQDNLDAFLSGTEGTAKA